MVEKLVATVFEITDLGKVQLAEGGSEERIDLDIQVQLGELSTAKRLRLSGPDYGEEIEIRAIYLTSLRWTPVDRSWVRITCSRRKSLTIPTGELAGWRITEL
jgi:hypothetical protein